MADVDGVRGESSDRYHIVLEWLVGWLDKGFCFFWVRLQSWELDSVGNLRVH